MEKKMTKKPRYLYLDDSPVSCITGTTDCYGSIKEAIEDLKVGDVIELTPYYRISKIKVQKTKKNWKKRS